eukprot:3954689-Pleurochrysis_carterae.AAC.3
MNYFKYVSTKAFRCRRRCARSQSSEMKLGTALSRPSRALTLTLAFAARSVRTTRITATRESTLFASRALRTARSITNVQMAHTDSTEVKKQKTGAFTSLESHSKNGAFERKESMHRFSVSSEPGGKELLPLLFS